MKIVHFLYKKQLLWGVLDKKIIKILKGSPFSKIDFSKQIIGLIKVKLLAPAMPQKIVLVGLNYKDHVKELNMKIPKQPIIFLKPVSALNTHKGDIKLPKNVKRLDYEAELAIVIKKKAYNIPESKVLKYILGYTCLNDITARDIQKKDGQWTRAKSFDTFCPIGPWLETDINPNNVNIAAYLNGKRKQYSSTSNLIFSIPKLVSFISKVMTLMPGDVVSTGTPSGVGKMKPGDMIEIAIDGIGILRNQVVR